MRFGLGFLCGVLLGACLLSVTAGVTKEEMAMGVRHHKELPPGYSIDCILMQGPENIQQADLQRTSFLMEATGIGRIVTYPEGTMVIITGRHHWESIKRLDPTALDLGKGFSEQNTPKRERHGSGG